MWRIVFYRRSVIIHLKIVLSPSSLFGHENLLFGFQYIHNISLSTFFLVDCGVVNAGLLQPVGVEIFTLGEIFVFLRGLDKNSRGSPFCGLLS